MVEDKVTAIKAIMYNIFIPLLHHILKSYNPVLYSKWQGNCCRQTAILGCYVLDELLPEYEWEAWEGQFDDVIYGKPVNYDHAWIFGKSKDGKHLFIDLARLHQERIFAYVTENKYPLGIPGYEFLNELSRSQIDWDSNIFNEKEYYTGQAGIVIAKAIMNKINEVKGGIQNAG